MSIEKKLNEDVELAKIQSFMQQCQSEIVQTTLTTTARRTADKKVYDAAKDRIQGIYDSMNLGWSRYSKKALPDYYAYSQSLTEKLMRQSGLEKLASKSSFGIRTVEAIIEDSVNDMVLASSGGYRNVERLFRETQQSVLKEQEINRLIAQGVVEGTPQAIKSSLQKELEKKIGEGKVLQAGSRSYEASIYAELLGRTRAREAQSEGAINTILSFGEDLVQISSHNTTTDICQEYEGEIFSLTGATPGYPVLDRSPPYHVNCQHVITPYVEAA